LHDREADHRGRHDQRRRVPVQVDPRGPSPVPADIARLFKPCFRPAKSDAASVLGLGLYIVSEIAKAHGGTADATAQEGELTFTLRIPRLPAADRS